MIHITYKTNDTNLFPEKYKKGYESLITHYKETHEIKLYDDDELHEIVKSFLKNDNVYDHFKNQKMIIKTDIFRYIILYMFGGIYMDLDIIWDKPIDLDYSKNVILSQEKVYLVQKIVNPNKVGNIIETDTFSDKKDCVQLSNYFIACQTKSTFIFDLINQSFVNIMYFQFYKIPKTIDNKNIYLLYDKLHNKPVNCACIRTKIFDDHKDFCEILMKTGPIMLGQIFYSKYENDPTIEVLKCIKYDHITDCGYHQKTFGYLKKMCTIKIFIVTYKNNDILNNTCHHLNECIINAKRTLSNIDVQVNIINNHSDFILDEKYKHFNVIHNQCRPDQSTGHLARNWNQAIMLGFENVKDPKCDILICMQNDCIMKLDALPKIIKAHETYSFIQYGRGDEYHSYTIDSVKKVGLWDEHYCGIHYQEYDYFIRQKLYNHDQLSI
eukprot:gene22990-27809_t